MAGLNNKFASFTNSNISFFLTWRPHTPTTRKSWLSVMNSEMESQKTAFSSTILTACLILGAGVVPLSLLPRLTGRATIGDSDLLLPSSLNQICSGLWQRLFYLVFKRMPGTEGPPSPSSLMLWLEHRWNLVDSRTVIQYLMCVALPPL